MNANKEISYQEILKREESDFSLYEWINPQLITSVPYNDEMLKNKLRYSSNFTNEIYDLDYDYGLTISMYLENCLKYDKNLNLNALDIINAALFIIQKLGSYSPVSGLSKSFDVPKEILQDCYNLLISTYQKENDVFIKSLIKDYISEFFYLSYPSNGDIRFSEYLTEEQNKFLKDNFYYE